MQLTGGCVCGAVRYRIDAMPFDAGYCHCTLCRRSSGSPVLGTQLAMLVQHQPDTLDFTLGSLDEPEQVNPGFHLFFRERVGWFDFSDGLPKHDGLRPHTRGLPPRRLSPCG
jgi:hypothetical protein